MSCGEIFYCIINIFYNDYYSLDSLTLDYIRYCLSSSGILNSKNIKFFFQTYFKEKIRPNQARSLLFISIVTLIFSISCIVTSSLIKKEHSDVENDIFVVWASAPVSSFFIFFYALLFFLTMCNAVTC